MQPNYHEKEVITLVAGEPQSRQELHVFLTGRGFTSEDDFYYLARRDVPKPWQSISVMTVHVANRGLDSCEIEDAGEVKTGLWEELSVDYLMATLPAPFIQKCAAECKSLAARFDLRIKLANIPVKPGGLLPALQQIADNLTAELDEPGSESLRILIEMSYPRRPAS